jgi:putative ABC transport system ATP-binding protein
MTHAVIRTLGLAKTYQMGKISVPALKPTDITINPGEYIAIIGPSGSGKSTLMNLIGCLDVPSEGSLYIDGIDVSTLPENELARIRREKIGFIFQKYNLIPTLSAMENVMLSMSFAGVITPERISRAKKLLQLVDLSHRLDHKPTELSGGEQQRVAIARALSNQPSLILADEPTGNVDTTAGKKIMDVLEEINQQGKTVITVTHDPDIAQRAHRILQITDGVVRDYNA